MALLPDDLVTGNPKPTRDLVARFKATGRAAISVMQVSLAQIDKYCVIRSEPNVATGAIPISGIAEKSSAADAPLNFAAVGRYVFGADVFEVLRKVKAGVGEEI